MDQERIKAELAAKRKPGSVVERLGGLKALASALTGRGVPSEIRAIITEAFSAMRPWAQVVSPTAEIGKVLAAQSEANQAAMVETLLPHVASSAVSAWKAQVRRPFQAGFGRRPFRCPRAATTVAGVRGRWLLNTTLLLGEYEADVRWVAEHAAYLAGWSGAVDIGWLLAGALDLGDDSAHEVQQILEASVLGEHEVGKMGRHVTQALMSCERPEAWSVVERLLLSAQRQEGLRQAILESVDESHPDAFRRMVHLIREEHLTRYSSVIRAADTWFGFMWDGSSAVKIDGILDRVILFLDDAAARRAALDESDGETVYLALWSIAFEDVNAAVDAAKPLLSSSAVDVRFAATHLLVQALWSSALPALMQMLDDADLRVAARALDAFGTTATSVTKHVDGARLFEHLERLIARVPGKSKALDTIVWPWWKRRLERETIAAVMSAHASGVPAEQMMPYVRELNAFGREAFVRRTAGLDPRWGVPARLRESKPKRHELSPSERGLIVELLGDAAAGVRGTAFEAMRGTPLETDEVRRLIDLLGRKPGDLRNGCLARLRELDDAELMAVVDTLLADQEDLRRLAGLELLRDAAEAHRSPAEVRTRAERYVATHPEPSVEERAHLDAVIDERRERPATVRDGLGLVDTGALRTPPEPQRRQVELDTAGARASLDALAALVLEHMKREIRTSSGETKLLIESVPLHFGPHRREDLDATASVPLAELWRSWLRERPPATRDADGLELLRALAAQENAAWTQKRVKEVAGLGQWHAGTRFLRGMLQWCLAWDPPPDATGFLLDGLETSIATLSPKDYETMIARERERGHPFRTSTADARAPYEEKLLEAQRWHRLLRWWRSLFPGLVRPADAARLYGLLRFFEIRAEGSSALSMTLDELAAACAAGAAGENDFLDALVGKWSVRRGTSVLRVASTRKAPRELAERPELLALVDKCRRRIVEVETQRGDRATAASALTMELRCTGGLDTLSRAVSALGASHFARTFGWRNDGSSRQDTLSHLVLRSVPGEEDTPEAFGRWVREARIPERRLVELAVYAPQWAAHVNHVLQWPELESAVWWIQAHTKDDRSWQLAEMKEIWAAEVSERTPLSASDLTEGAVDVAWFHTAHAGLGPKRWAELDKAAKYAASSTGHTRAQLFARAMTGQVTRDELLARIDKRHQDSVRAVGLLPLADGDAGRADLLARYTRLQEFRRESRKFGAQRQQSEKRAVTIALANLARTAGFRDPQRLQWAMEQEAVADLAQGPVCVEKGDVRFELSIDVDGAPAMRVTRNGKALKAAPASLKKDADVVEMKDRLQELKRQRSRVRDGLEEAMCRGDAFLPSELRTLLRHPILAPALSRLVFVGDGPIGYPDEGGRVLRDHSGTKHVLGSDETVRIAHPHDLLATGTWSAWQQECFRAERVQPFKQLFRELYPLTDTERDAERTRRYAGHQVNPRQALALLGGRGWVARPEEGVSRTFHEEGLTVRLGFEEPFFTPADIEGLTLDEVMFTPKGEWHPLALRDIPPRLFSEAMRDLDLVVSVAHQGGVDPEASASTVEMRAALVQETCGLLGLSNVEMQSHHAIVHGALGTYSIHLGSAGVMLMPGTALPIVAVHSQHRGRLFLPFADDDPRTAEVLSKVLLFSRDGEIRDPGILDRIRAAGG